MCLIAAGDALLLVSFHSGVFPQQDLQARLESPSLWDVACCRTNASSAADLGISRYSSGDDGGDGSLPPRQAAPACRRHPAVSPPALRRR